MGNGKFYNFFYGRFECKTILGTDDTFISRLKGYTADTICIAGR
jgi:hypothetical protein